ncbi:uncharacterized protein LOC110698332 isoform X1 [Chenopodium quinoa]|uniref:uncharacterized protein LOC110698332 isoform X1 n=1 Tax=Chenopodium quinoa TaxID=63459 RepID=UPI000B796AB5|nr:uncharacterized protein LOC110698332 isoform X1 [Chenopodium quinoa]
MAEDSEKRFHSIMNKLFHSPKSNVPLSSSSSSGQKTRGQKRLFSVIESNLKGDKGEGQNAAQAPPCRPWNREDLMGRLATFKSMRWFAKPKAVDAVNCARRGWVNVDFDIIACEICGARLQFSTPSAWNQQQVEKAALVFSLKLESGHKLLCPWIDNACDAKLALFPPMPAPVLVDHYKERSSALLQLSALPVIPASVVESMRSSQLKHFLKQSIAVECGSAPNDSCWTEYLGNDAEVVSADLYYQAHRLLSLCGWEPRLLPYMVDCEDQPKLSGSNDNTSNLSHAAADEQSNRLSVSMSASNENIREDDDPGASSFYYDPNSTVLDCKLCGANIGLWAFATVPRPLELVKVVGQADIGGGSNLGSKTSAIENHANHGNSDLAAANGEAASPRKTMSNLTIAGGPPPTRQNFRATISLPVIGRNVRTRLSYMSSDVSTGEVEPIALNAIMDSSTKDKQNEETNSGVSGSEPQDNAPSTADIASSQEMIVDSTALRKETLSLTSGEQNENGVATITSQNDMATLSVDEDISRQSPNKKMEFHPIKQHRHFCPWVASTGTVSPGWQQTLSALQKEKVFTVPELESSPSSPSPSLIMVDDPITSIRKLFESPPAKRPKHASK